MGIVTIRKGSAFMQGWGVYDDSYCVCWAYTRFGARWAARRYIRSMERVTEERIN